MPAPTREVHSLISRQMLTASSDQAAIELLGDLAKSLFPGVNDISQLDPQERARWILVQRSVLQSQQATKDFVDQIAAAIGGVAEAEASQVLALAEQTAGEQGERHRQALREREERLHQELRERQEIHAQQLKERQERHELEIQERLKRLGSAQVQTRIQPPPPSAVYTTLFGNQLRWASHVIRYALQEHRLRTKGTRPKAN